MEFVNYDSAKESAACGAGTHTDGCQTNNMRCIASIIEDEKGFVNER